MAWWKNKSDVLPLCPRPPTNSFLSSFLYGEIFGLENGATSSVPVLLENFDFDDVLDLLLFSFVGLRLKASRVSAATIVVLQLCVIALAVSEGWLTSCSFTAFASCCIFTFLSDDWNTPIR